MKPAASAVVHWFRIEHQGAVLAFENAYIPLSPAEKDTLQDVIERDADVYLQCGRVTVRGARDQAAAGLVEATLDEMREHVQQILQNGADTNTELMNKLRAQAELFTLPAHKRHQWTPPTADVMLRGLVQAHTELVANDESLLAECLIPAAWKRGKELPMLYVVYR